MKRYLIFAALLALICLGLCALGEEEAHVHEWTDYATTVEPTCTSTGTQVRICKVCGASETLTLEMADHEFGAWEYYSDEYHVHTCSVCGTREMQVHDSAIAKTVTAPADDRLGKRDITCAGCGYNYTRLVSKFDRLYTMDGIDVVGDGSAYLKVNTFSFQQGSEKQLTLYSDGIFDIYAESNMTVEIYADAESGEFRGVKLTNGSATLKVTGQADLDFILPTAGTNLSIEFKEGEGSLTLMSSNKALTYLDAQTAEDGAHVNVITSQYESHKVTVTLNSYLADKAVLILTKGEYKPFDAQLLSSATWVYDTRSGELTASSTSGRLTVMSGSATLLNGASAGTLSQSDLPWGWYCLYTSTDGSLTIATPTYTYDGLISEAPANKSIAQQEPAPESTPAPSGNEDEKSEESSEPSVVLSPASEYSETFGSSPKIEISFSSNVYTVKVSAIPSGYKLDHIEFMQTYAGGFRLKNGYGEEVRFDPEPYSGRIRSAAIFTDSKGNERRVEAGEYAYKAE